MDVDPLEIGMGYICVRLAIFMAVNIYIVTFSIVEALCDRRAPRFRGNVVTPSGWFSILRLR
jgi:hypothetical protein